MHPQLLQQEWESQQILEKAEDSEVPDVFNKELTDLLCNVDVGDAIPTEVYDAVAHIIAYITELDSSLQEVGVKRWHYMRYQTYIQR